jgi:hypothetical protein
MGWMDRRMDRQIVRWINRWNDRWIAGEKDGERERERKKEREREKERRREGERERACAPQRSAIQESQQHPSLIISHRYPISETSATALRGTTGTYSSFDQNGC